MLLEALRRMFRHKTPELIKAEVHAQPEIREADEALRRFYLSIRAAERGAVLAHRGRVVRDR